MFRRVHAVHESWQCGSIARWPLGAVIFVGILSRTVAMVPVDAAEPATATAQTAAANEDALRFFESKVRPLLIEHCLECHGPNKQESGLRLDRRTSILSGGDSGPAAVAGHPEQSLLITAVLRTGDIVMPPEKPLSREQQDVLSHWVRIGMPWAAESQTAEDDIASRSRTHWAFQPVARPDVPVDANDDWSRNELDRFIRRKQRDSGLVPAPETTPQVFIRRATLALTGLPPTPEETAAFVAAVSAERGAPAPASDTAVSELINRLLQSPRYGERWARHWLDVARYADNKGYVFFEDANYAWAWTYRDYVINAFNNDLPYDRFVQEQLAADQLVGTGDDPAPLAAMGFLTLGARFMGNTHDVMDDRIDVVTRGLMGLTVTCGRCHDHKFDPVSQADYYALYGVFRSSLQPLVPPLFTAPPDTDEYRAFVSGLAERQQKLDDFVNKHRNAAIDGARTRIAEYLLAVHERRHHPSTENFMLIADQGGIIPLIVTRWESWLKTRRREHDPVWKIWHTWSDLSDAEFSTRAAELSRELSAQTDSHPLVHAAFDGFVPESIQQVAERYQQLLREIDQQWQAANEQAASSGGPAPDRLPDEHAESLRQVLYGPGSPPMLEKELTWGFLDLLPDRPSQGEFQKLLKEVESFSTSGPGAPPRAMSLQDAATPYDPVVFLRGNPNRQGEPVARRFLTAFAAGAAEPFQHGSGRLELARAITSPDNPLTARVFVNRVWQWHFGTGLVNTPGDFGLRSQPPSHPELLDWLTAQFIDSGWSVKALQRLIMTSATYRQSSVAQPDVLSVARRVDPENRLLWKFPRRRLNFEALRDSLLAVSGSLNESIGGPAVQIEDGFNPRRTIYGFVDRMNPSGLRRAFDFPEPAATTPQREITTVAPQALFLLNHDFAWQIASRLLQRSDLPPAADREARVRRVYQLLLARDPDEFELDLADRFFAPQPTDAAVDHRLAAWQYGYGGVSADTSRVANFTPLTFWTGSRWQNSAALPDPQTGWVFIDRNGGHPASSPDRCAIRRWTAPSAMTIRIAGTLKHVPEPGNGIRARIVHSPSDSTLAGRVLGEWKADHSEATTGIESLPLAAGDTVDFVVDWQDEILHDEFEWPVRITGVSLANADAEPPVDAATLPEWDSVADFRSGQSDPWTDYVHALLMTNEFAFID